MRKVHTYLILCAICVFLLIFTGSNGIRKKDECGIITYKTQSLHVPYKGTDLSVNKYLYVIYDTGKEIKEQVDERLYETKNIGDRVCFKSYNVIPFIFIGILGFVFGFLCLYYLIIHCYDEDAKI